jgi:hypothetical protein
MKNAFSIILLVSCIAFMPVLTFAVGCVDSSNEGFAIYLPEYDVLPTKMEALSHVELAEQPLIAARDIITYNALTHEIKLTATAFERILDLQVPVSGKSFLVCVDRNPVYWGAFWTPISSMSFDGVTIWKPLGNRESSVITLELGYPSASFYNGEDPRSDPEILNSLESSGKIINRLSLSNIERLPHSMKGYELYSWSEDGKWRFTLITGTNRNKTLDEIVSGENVISGSRWVNVRVTGLEAIKEVLSKLPQDEFVIWIEGIRGQLIESDQIQFPDAQIISDIKEHAINRGLDLQIQTP